MRYRKGERYSVSSRYEEYERSLQEPQKGPQGTSDKAEKPLEDGDGEASVAHGEEVRIASDEASAPQTGPDSP